MSDSCGTVTRAYLSDIVSKQYKLTNSEASLIVDVVFDTIIEGLKKDDVVKISSFGSFYTKEKKQRMGRNPKTKKEALIEARKVVAFYASNSLKKLIRD